jgi:Phosphotransferase enzyme family
MNEQGDHVSYRVLVFGRDGTEILLTRSGSGLQLPEVSILESERMAEKVTNAIEKQWGEIVVCLFEPDWPLSDESSRYVVARHWRSCESSSALLRWIPIRDLSERGFSVPDDIRVVQESLARCRVPGCETHPGPFTNLNWFEELCEWATKAINTRGLRLTGNFRQLNASPAFSLIRFETNGPAMWFKAVGAPNKREFPITLALANDFPKYMPDLIAARSDWNAWLTCEAGTTDLAETRNPSLWRSAAAALAKLQIESIANCERLIGCGAHDSTPTRLLETVSPFLEVIAELMNQQPKISPTVLSKGDLAVLSERIRNGISALLEFEIPDTLGHLDLNPGNIIVSSPAVCVFLDWAEAYVGHPFYSFQYLLQHFRRMAGEDPIAEHAFSSSYLHPWSDLASVEALREAMALAPLVAVFAYGAGTNAWRTPERLRDPKVAGYLRALARRMKREADQLSERSAPCLS